MKVTYLGPSDAFQLASGEVVLKGGTSEEDITQEHAEQLAALGNDDFAFDEWDPDEVAATAAAQSKADELGVDLTEVEGTGKDGRATVADVEAAAPQEEVEGPPIGGDTAAATQPQGSRPNALVADEEDPDVEPDAVDPRAVDADAADRTPVRKPR